jgi:protein ImuB
VQAVWGPERLAGEWWEGDGYARDYYRVELEGVGELWVFRDGRDGRLYAQGVFD